MCTVASGLLGGPASENGKLRHGDGDSEGGNRCRRGLVLTTLSMLGTPVVTDGPVEYRQFFAKP
jgi:hypothetical protein